MSSPVVFLVLIAALLHAGWNALLRSRADPRAATCFAASAAGAIALPVAMVSASPAPAAWTCLAASVAIHVAYFELVGAAYARAPLSFAYPLARGTAPLLVAAGAAFALRETLSPWELGAVGLLSAGVLSLARAGAVAGESMRAAVALSLANGVVIATYSLVDGYGVRLSGSPMGYTAWMFAISGAAIAAGARWRLKTGLASAVRREWPAAACAGLGSVASYAIVLWAMTRAPVALVAALRETSIVFGTLIGALLLRERPSARAWAALGLVAIGAIGLRLR